MTPRLSIVVPVYNVEPYLQRCIDSIMNQTYMDYEMILIDDGSTDQSGHICDAAADKDPRLKVIHQKNSGLSAARNTGLDMAQGEYITFIDSDDIISESKSYENGVKLLTDNLDVDIVQFPFSRFTESDPVPQKPVVHVRKLFTKEAFINNLDTCSGDWKSSIFSGAPAKIYRRSIFDGIRYPIGVNWEDIHVLLQLFDRIKGIMISDCGLYGYFYREDSIAHSAPKPKPMIDKLNSLIAVYRFVLSNSNQHSIALKLYLSIIFFIGKNMSRFGKSWDVSQQVSFLGNNRPTKTFTLNVDNFKLFLINILGINGWIKLKSLINRFT